MRTCKSAVFVLLLVASAEHHSESALAPPGLKAVTLRVSCDTSCTCFVLPGASVDILGTVVDPGYPGRKMTKTLVADVLVLDIKDEAPSAIALVYSKCCDFLGLSEPAWIRNQRCNRYVATIAASPAQAEILAVSDSTLWMVLRKTSDQIAKTAGLINPFDDHPEIP